MLIVFRLGNLFHGNWFFLFIFFIIVMLKSSLVWWWRLLRLNDFITETFNAFNVGLRLREFPVKVGRRRDADDDGHDRECFSIERQHIYVIETLNLFK